MKIIFLFLLPIAVGFGVEKFVNIPLKKHKQQLQNALPKSFIQLVSRLSARSLIELISFSVFAVTVLGLYLLFYPTQSPLYELAMVYLPPEVTGAADEDGPAPGSALNQTVLGAGAAAAIARRTTMRPHRSGRATSVALR